MHGNSRKISMTFTRQRQVSSLNTRTNTTATHFMLHIVEKHVPSLQSPLSYRIISPKTLLWSCTIAQCSVSQNIEYARRNAKILQDKESDTDPGPMNHYFFCIFGACLFGKHCAVSCAGMWFHSRLSALTR